MKSCHSLPCAARLQARSGGASYCLNAAGTAGAARLVQPATMQGLHCQGPVLACPGAQPGSGVPLAAASSPWPPASLRAALGAPAPCRQPRLGAPAPPAPAPGAPAPLPQVTPVPAPLGPDLCLHGLRHQHTARSEWTNTPGQSEQSASIAQAAVLTTDIPLRLMPTARVRPCGVGRSARLAKRSPPPGWTRHCPLTHSWWLEVPLCAA